MTSASGNYANAVALARAGRLDDAAVACRRALAAAPRDPALLDLAGTIARLKGDYAEALRYFTDAVATDPKSANIRLHLGSALRSVGGREEEAIGELRRAIELQSDVAEAHHQLGNALKSLHRYTEAVGSLERAVQLSPGDAAAWLNLGVAQMELQRPRDAVVSFQRAVEIEPSRPEARNILGVALLEAGRVSDAQAALLAALKLRPNYAAAHNNLARVYKTWGRVGEAIAEYRAALAAQPDAGTHSNLLYALNFLPDISPADVFAEHRRWAEMYERHAAAAFTKPLIDRSPERRLLVGFVSPDLVNHAVAYFFESLLRGRDASEWELFAYSDARKPDHVTQRLRSGVDVWRDTAGLRDDALCAQIQADRIDVLFDLAGHTARNRLPAFARKPTPIQITWLGYPNTTGLEAMDYRITDAIGDPPGMTDGWHSEKLLRLPDVFLCYTPPEETPAPSPPPALHEGWITFGSFSNYAKLSEPCVRVWSEVLNQVPRSRLVLKSRGLADAEVADALFARFAQFGVEKDRIQLDGQLVSVAEHLRQYCRIDLALDPFPYNGTTTTCEALWMGVPVVTLAGASHVGRVGASLLTQLGASEWVATSAADYVAICVSLASDLQRLAAIRAGLRERMHSSPLIDAHGFARKLERAVRECWRRFCAAG